MELFLQRCFDGVSSGATYALVAVALVLIFKATTLVNFAQGEQALLGAFLTLQCWSWGVPMWGAVAIAMVLTAALGAAIERVFIRPFDPAEHLPLVIVTLGLFLVINAIVAIVWGFDPRQFPELFPSGTALTVGGARLSWYTVGTLATVVVVLGVLQAVLNRSKAGLAFRAVSANLTSAELVGIRVGRMLQFGWALAAAVGTLAASVYAADPLQSLEPSVMARVLIFAVSAAALGGLDSLWGSLIGGLVIGLVQSLVVQYVPFIPSEMSLAAAVLVLLGVLLVRPAGIAGTRRVERV